MKERPILFSGPMVRAILDGRKTQTRRVLSFQPKPEWAEIAVEYPHGKAMATYRAYPNGGTARWGICECPYGAPSDRLWVRETWGWSSFASMPPSEQYPQFLCYRTGDIAENAHVTRWRPSIHMPRWASRLTLEVTAVRVERLQSISAKDIISEGAVDRPHHIDGLGKCPVSAFDGVCYPDLRSLWVKAWDSINAKRGYGWTQNPWVWVIEFKKL